MRHLQANTNGLLHPADQPVISPLDRGFLYGDAIYEVWRTYHGTVFAFREHWTRLGKSAAALHMPLPFDAPTAWRELRRTVAAYRETSRDTGELYIRLQISRGAGPIGLDPALADQPLWTFIVQSLPRLPEEKMRAGLRVATATALRRNHPLTLNPLWKTGNYLNNLLALREAKAAGVDEVLLLNLDGEITEASTMNIAFIRGGTVLTPPLSAGMLAGITRALFLNHIAPLAGINVRETALRPTDLPNMDEAFFLSTTKDITPISSIDGHAYATGPSTLTHRLKENFATFTRTYADSHPEYKLP